jgi:hypothetical protein
MFFVNMLGAILLLPALAALFVRKVVPGYESRDSTTPSPSPGLQSREQ